MKEYIKFYFEEHGLELKPQELCQLYTVADYINNKVQVRDDYKVAVRHVFKLYQMGAL
jgi:hypothetical protein